MKFGLISPQDWGLPVARAESESPIEGLDVSPAELERRARHCIYDWAPLNYDSDAGAFFGFYRAPERSFEPPQTTNLIAPMMLLAAYDRYQDPQLLQKASRANDWFYQRFVMTHPMSIAIGGVRESAQSSELWTKFAAEFVILSLGLYERSGEELYLQHAQQSAGFLLQSTRYGYAPRYDFRHSQWLDKGWQSFGRVVEAFLLLADATGAGSWRDLARQWGELGLTLLSENGGLYLIDGDYFNTDLAADELRAFTFLYELAQEQRYLAAAEGFAGWLLARQRQDGAWPLTIDRDGNVVVPTVGPGDIPNIAIALLRLHHVTGNARYLQAAQRALAYALTTQVLPNSDHPFADDPVVQWGFWSWDPYYDHTLSGDQATHHVRGMLFFIDYHHEVLASRV